MAAIRLKILIAIDRTRTRRNTSL